MLRVDVGAPAYEPALALWVFGSAATVAGGWVLSVALNGLMPAWVERLSAALDRRAGVILAVACVASFALNALVASSVFGGQPLHIDELTQAIQAKTFAAGRLWTPTPAHVEFTSALLVVDRGGRTFGQFPPGWPALLALGELFGARWLVAPAVGAAATAALFLLARALGESRRFGLAAAGLGLLAPWLVFNAATQMNHTATLAALTFAAAVLIMACGRERSSPWVLAGAGALAGAAAMMRPLDAAAFMLPAFVWLGVRAVRRRSPYEPLMYGLGAAVPIGLLLLYNMATTGSPWMFGYEAQWGAAYGLGFHAAPWGAAHTPLRGLALLNEYLLRLQVVLFESPVPALLAPLLALALAPRVSAGDRYMLAATAGLCLGYFLYWHEGEYLGPRFLLPVAPAVIIWTLRLPAVLTARTGRPFAGRWAVASLVIAIAAGLVRLPPVVAEYAASYPLRRVDADALAQRDGVRDALIFVPSPWRAQLSPRLWALGVDRAGVESVASRIDACTLERAVTSFEARDIRGATALDALETLAGDAGLAQRVTDPESIAVAQTNARSELCLLRAQAERAGTWSLLPFLLESEGNRFVRDMHERNERLLEEHPGPYFVVRPDPVGGTREPRIVPLNVDSARWAWTVAGWTDATR